MKYGPPRGFKPTASAEWATELVWFDAATYLPVRTKITGIGPVEERVQPSPSASDHCRTI